jgi:hypothetical protein
MALTAEIKAKSDSIAVSKSLYLKTGLYNMASIDKLYSPFSYSGKSGAFGLGWGRVEPKRSSETSILFSSIRREAVSLRGLPDSYPDDHYLIAKNSFIFDVMDYYRFLIQHNQKNQMQIYFSGLWSTFGNISTNSMGVPELIQSSLAPGIMLSKKTDKHTFEVEFNIQLITLSVRNNYAMSMEQTYEELNKFNFIGKNIRIQTPISNPAFLVDLSYMFSMSKSFSLKGNYMFRYFKNNKPQSLEQVSGIYTISIIYNY